MGTLVGNLVGAAVGASAATSWAVSWVVWPGGRQKVNFACSVRRRTNVQQLTCSIDLSCSFYYLFFSFVLIELKRFVLKGKVLGEKF